MAQCYDLLMNASAAFQRFMNNIFSDMVDICVVIYLDNILIYSNNIDLHCTYVREVPRQFRENVLFARAHKCSFHTNSINYLGYILFPTGLSMDSEKIQTIQDWLEPRKVKDNQSFLGFANFYCQF